MINLSTPNKELLREINSEIPKVEYWLKKQMGGEAQFSQCSNYLYRKAKSTKQIEYSDNIEYISAKGNRWFCGLSVGSPSGNILPFVQTNMFVYYETIGSIGAFVPSKRLGTGKDSCVIFTSHFFYQFCERAKIPYRSRNMIMAFNRVLPIMSFNTTEDRGKREVLCRLPGGVGFGFPRNDDLSIIEIRTYLTDEELNKRQEYVSRDLRKMADDKATELLDMSIGANIIDTIGAFKVINSNAVKSMEDSGLDKNLAKSAADILSIVYCIFASLGYVGRMDFSQQSEHFKLNKEFAIKALGSDLKDDDLFESLMRDCSKKLKIKDFKLNKCMEYLHSVVDDIKKNKYDKGKN